MQCVTGRRADLVTDGDLGMLWGQHITHCMLIYVRMILKLIHFF